MQKEYDFLIVGAGLFGAVFARQVTDAGYTCLVIDKRHHIGGNVYTENVDDIQVHNYGAHIFHTNDESIWKYVNRFADFNNYRHKVKVSFEDRQYSFPINLETFEEMFGITSEQEAIEYLENLPKLEKGDDLESWAIRNIGKKLYETFIKGYTEKQWGRPASELPSSIVKRIPIRTHRNDDYFNDTYQGIPIGGYTSMVAQMLDGIDVRLGVDYLITKHGLDRLAQNVVFTGPIDAYYDYKFGALAYRGLEFEHERLKQDSFQDTAVVNYTEASTPFTRIIEHKKFNNTESKETIVTKEYPKPWKPGEEAYYPINDEENKSLYQKYLELSKQETKVIFGGRLAEYKYYDMHQVIASALTKSALFINTTK